MQEHLKEIIDGLRKGDTIIYPTDSIWGLGCDAQNEEAVQKVFNIKQRPEGLPLVILLFNENQLFDYVEEVPEIAFQLIDAADRPLTIVYEKGKNLAKNVMAADGSVAIRLCQDRACYDLLRRFNKPLVSTSVNISGQPFASQFDEISPEILDQVDLIYNKDFPIKAGRPSQIIRINNDATFKIIRE